MYKVVKLPQTRALLDKTPEKPIPELQSSMRTRISLGSCKLSKGDNDKDLIH